MGVGPEHSAAAPFANAMRPAPSKEDAGALDVEDRQIFRLRRRLVEPVAIERDLDCRAQIALVERRRRTHGDARLARSSVSSAYAVRKTTGTPTSARNSARRCRRDRAPDVHGTRSGRNSLACAIASAAESDADDLVSQSLQAPSM